MVYAGEGTGEPAGFWRWVIIAQVKEGTESRGSIEAVIRGARKALKESHPEVPLPPKTRRAASEDGWGMLDVGETAVHVLSRQAREKWFAMDGEGDPWGEGARLGGISNYAFRAPN